jgi:hypothetical protein
MITGIITLAVLLPWGAALVRLMDPRPHRRRDPQP